MMNLNHQHHLLQLMTHFIMTYKSHFNIILSVFSVLEYSEQIICISFVKLCSFIIFFLFDKCVKVAGKSCWQIFFFYRKYIKQFLEDILQHYK